MVEQVGRTSLAPDVEPDHGWLTEEQQAAWRQATSLFLVLPGALDAQLQRDSGLNLFEYFVMSGLSMAEDRAMRMSELAEFANGSLSRLSNVVKRLEQRGWVMREPDPANGRYTRARLTETGWRTVVDAAPGHVEAVRRLFVEPLTTAQLRAVGDAGRRVRQKVESEGRCTPCEPPMEC